jgi:hypothetical protein
MINYKILCSVIQFYAKGGSKLDYSKNLSPLFKETIFALNFPGNLGGKNEIEIH